MDSVKITYNKNQHRALQEEENNVNNAEEETKECKEETKALKIKIVE